MGKMSHDLLAELIDQSRGQSPQPKYEIFGRSGSKWSFLTIPSDKAIRAANGTSQALSGLRSATRVFCPFHTDKNPSAFVVHNQGGVPGIHCSTCNTTYWPPGDRIHNFNSFDAKAAEIRAHYEQHQDPGPLFAAQYSERHEGLIGANVVITDGYPTPHRLERGLTLIKSPKGSGKTEGLNRLLLEDDSKLLIGHRRALIRQSSNRLRLSCYLDREEWSRDELGDRQRNYAICLDSLFQIRSGTEYGVIILDESEQILAHFLSETLDRGAGGFRDRLFGHFRQLLQNAKSVVALDADLGWISFAVLHRAVCRQTVGLDRKVRKAKPVYLWINRS